MSIGFFHAFTDSSPSFSMLQLRLRGSDLKLGLLRLRSIIMLPQESSTHYPYGIAGYSITSWSWDQVGYSPWHAHSD